jgi:hypothetical protein
MNDIIRGFLNQSENQRKNKTQWCECDILKNFEELKAWDYLEKLLYSSSEILAIKA